MVSVAAYRAVFSSRRLGACLSACLFCQWLLVCLPVRQPGLPACLCHQAVDVMVALTGSEDIPVKKLLLWLEMARQELPDPDSKITLQAWTKVLQNLSTGHSSSSGFSKSKFGSSGYIGGM